MSIYRLVWFIVSVVSAGTKYQSYQATGTNGGVATEAPECSKVGVELLRKGGSGVDAAIGATLCQGVIYPFASGIGGGGFMLIKEPGEAQGTFIDFREIAPGSASQDMFSKFKKNSNFGGLAVGVPGELRGMEAAYRLYGRLPWKELFEPAIKLAKGHLAPHQLPVRLERRKEFINQSPELKKKYTRNGRFIREGEQVILKELAETLETVANKGADAVYNGPIAEKLVKTIKENGGIITKDDLKHYRVNITKSLTGKYLDKNIHFLPSPASGSVVYHILKLIQNLPEANNLSPDAAHHIIEAFKFGFAGRTKLGDTKFINLDKIMNELTNSTEIQKNLNLIDPKRTKHPNYYYQNFDSKFRGNDPKGTSHVNVIDSTGLAVSVTSTINLEFGAKVLCPVTGVLLNCQMDDFSSPGLTNYFGLKPSPSNYIAPNKRPLSSMSPLIIEDTNSILAIGGSGGSRIISAVTQVLYNYLQLNHPLYDAISLGRFHHQLDPNELSIESGQFSSSLIKSLKARGHKLVEHEIPESAISAVHATYKPSKRTPSKFKAVSDVRKSGRAAAY